MQSQKLVLTQKQELRLSPQLLQSIKILSLPIQELRQRIEEEIEINPALEILEDHESTAISKEELEPDSSQDLDPFENSSDPGYTRGPYDEEGAENQRRFMEQLPSKPESLWDQLLWQLRLHALSEDHFQIGELIIRNLDSDGFHIEDPLSLVPDEQYGVLNKMLKLVQSFDPPGCACYDFRESLKAQAHQFAYIPLGTEEIIDQHLEALDRGKIKELGKILGLSVDEVEEAVHFIQQLNPFPGRSYGTEETSFVIPEIQVVRRDDEFLIILNDELIPVLSINPFFDQLHDKKHGKNAAELQTYVQNKLRDARWFINSVRTRNQSLLKVAGAIVEYQKEFFLKGPRALVPLTLKDIAQDIGVHETTVSRVTNGKYMQTEWGLFELKHFFSSALDGTSGERFSKEGVKHLIKEIVEAEQEANMSDQRIAQLLEKRGVKIARRTVAKYRKELNIDSSYER